MRIYVAPGHGLNRAGVLDPGAVSGHEVEHTLAHAVVAARGNGTEELVWRHVEHTTARAEAAAWALRTFHASLNRPQGPSEEPGREYWRQRQPKRVWRGDHWEDNEAAYPGSPVVKAQRVVEAAELCSPSRQVGNPGQIKGLSGTISLTVFPAVSHRVSAAGNRSANVTANALRAGFQRIAHLVLAVPTGSKDRVTRYRHFSAAASLGKWPLALIARR
jgi:hypothetical protein